MIRDDFRRQGQKKALHDLESLDGGPDGVEPACDIMTKATRRRNRMASCLQEVYHQEPDWANWTTIRAGSPATYSLSISRGQGLCIVQPVLRLIQGTQSRNWLNALALKFKVAGIDK